MLGCSINTTASLKEKVIILKVRIVDKIVNYLYDEYDVTDIFGIPGGVVLPFLDAISKNDNVESHLSTNEQHSILSAIGYSRVSKKLGVVYATKGPGLTNFITGITFAYHDSFPLLIITAHDEPHPNKSRHNGLQNLNTIVLTKSITKKSEEINNIDHLEKFYKMCKLAINGRKGPVVADFSHKLLVQNLED